MYWRRFYCRRIDRRSENSGRGATKAEVSERRDGQICVADTLRNDVVSFDRSVTGGNRRNVKEMEVILCEKDRDYAQRLIVFLKKQVNCKYSIRYYTCLEEMQEDRPLGDHLLIDAAEHEKMVELLASVKSNTKRRGEG